MNIVVLGASPEREEVMQTPWEFVSGVCIDGLEQTHGDPNVNSENVKVAEECAPEKRRANGPDSQEENLDGRCVFGGKAEGGGVRVVNFVHVPVKPAPMERAVRPVVPGVFHDEENSDLEGHFG